MRGREDNEVGAKRMPCCGKMPAECKCLWEQRKKVLRQQLMGGNNGPIQQSPASIAYIPKLRPGKQRGV